MFTEFSSANNWKQTSQSPAKGAEHIFLWSKFFFFFSLGEIKDIFQFFFNFHSLTSCALNKKQK